MANVSRYMFQAAAGAGGGPSYFALITTGNGIRMDSDYTFKNIRSLNRDGNGGFFASYNVRESNTLASEHGYMLHFNNLGEVLLSQEYNGASGQEATENIADVIPSADQYFSLYKRGSNYYNSNRYSDTPSVVGTSTVDYNFSIPGSSSPNISGIKIVSSSVGYVSGRNSNADGGFIWKFNPSSGITSTDWYYYNSSGTVADRVGVSSLDVDSNGNPFFWYNDGSGGTTYGRWGVFKYNSSGTRQWGYVNNSGNNCNTINMQAMVVTPQDEAILLMIQGSPERTDAIVFQNNSADLLQKTLYYSDNTSCYAVAGDRDSNGNLYVLVNKDQSQPVNFNAPQYLYKINSSGTVVDSVSIADSSGYLSTNNFFGRRVRIDETEDNPGIIIGGMQRYSSPTTYLRPAVLRLPLDFSLLSSSGSWTFGTAPTLSSGNPDPSRPDVQSTSVSISSSASFSSTTTNTSQLTSTTTSLTEF